MKKLMEIMNEAETKATSKKTLTEDCSHDAPCACNSYLCESCYPPKSYDTVKGNDMPKVGQGPANPKDPMINDDGQMSPMSRSAEIAEETEELNYSDKADALRQWNDKYKQYHGSNADELPNGWIQAMTNTGIPSDGWEENEWHNALQQLGSDEEWGEEEQDAAYDMSPITSAMMDDLYKILGVDVIGEDELSAVHQVLDTMDEGADRMRMQELAGIQEAPEEDEFDGAEAGDSSSDFEVAPDAMGAAPDADPMAPQEFTDTDIRKQDQALGKAVQGDAPMNVDDLMAEIMQMQHMGMSQAKIDYTDDMLIQMSPERMQRTYSKVMGEAMEEGEDYDAEGAAEQGEMRSREEKEDAAAEYFSEDASDPYEQFEADPDHINKLNDFVASYGEHLHKENYEEWLDRYVDEVMSVGEGREEEDRFARDEEERLLGEKSDPEFEAKVHELYRQTAGMDGAAEIIAKKMGVEVEEVRRVLDEAMVAEAELKRLKDLVNY